MIDLVHFLVSHADTLPTPDIYKGYNCYYCNYGYCGNNAYNSLEVIVEKNYIRLIK